MNILDFEEGANRHSGVHAPTLVIARPNSTSEEEEDEMALNWGNKSLRDLMATRNKGPSSQEAPKSQVAPTLPLPRLLPLTDLGLHALPNLKKKRPVQELKEGEVASQKGTKQQKTTRGPKDKRSSLVDNREEEQSLAEVRLQPRTWPP